MSGERRHRARQRRWPARLFAALATIGAASTAASDIGSIGDARFATQLGASGAPAAAGAMGAASGAAPDFNGLSAVSCSSVDLNAFLQSFDPHELLNELRLSLISGAQSALSNYLLALAYSAPTLASVLDIADKTLNARFGAFARVCATEQAHSRAASAGARKLAQATEQCFALEMARGSPPTDALRRCTVARQFDGLALPAALPTGDFLRRFTNLTLTPRLQALLALLPDERIQAGNYQARPARLAVTALADHWQTQARLALDRIDAGAEASSIPTCAPADIVAGSGSGCLPASASALVNSPAFRGTRLLAPDARALFKDALAGQIGVAAMYTDLLDLAQAISTVGLRGGEGNAEEIVSRQQALQQQAVHLLGQADLRMKLEQSRMRLAQTQLLALERAQADLQTQAASVQAEQAGPPFALRNLLQAFADRP